jgi:hypothetical protein
VISHRRVLFFTSGSLSSAWKSVSFTKIEHDLDLKKAHTKKQGLKFRYRYVFSNEICEQMACACVCFARTPKSQTSTRTAVIIFRTMFCMVDFKRKLLLFQLRAPNQSMAFSYEKF